MTTCYRVHMRNHHSLVYEAKIQELGLKHSTPNSLEPGTTADRGPFSLDTFHRLLMKWIAVDDQVCLFYTHILFSSSSSVNLSL